MRIIRISLNIIVFLLLCLSAFTYYSMTNSDYDWIGQSNKIIWYLLLALNFLLLRFNYDHKTKRFWPGIILFIASCLGTTALFLFPVMIFELWNYVALITLCFATYTLWRIVNIQKNSSLFKALFLIAPLILSICLLLKWIPDYFGIIMLVFLAITTLISFKSLLNKSSKAI